MLDIDYVLGWETKTISWKMLKHSTVVLKALHCAERLQSWVIHLWGFTHYYTYTVIWPLVNLKIFLRLSIKHKYKIYISTRSETFPHWYQPAVVLNFHWHGSGFHRRLISGSVVLILTVDKHHSPFTGNIDAPLPTQFFFFNLITQEGWLSVRPDIKNQHGSWLQKRTHLPQSSHTWAALYKGSHT